MTDSRSTQGNQRRDVEARVDDGEVMRNAGEADEPRQASPLTELGMVLSNNREPERAERQKPRMSGAGRGHAGIAGRCEEGRAPTTPILAPPKRASDLLYCHVPALPDKKQSENVSRHQHDRPAVRRAPFSTASSHRPLPNRNGETTDSVHVGHAVSKLVRSKQLGPGQ